MRARNPQTANGLLDRRPARLKEGGPGLAHRVQMTDHTFPATYAASLVSNAVVESES